MPRKRTISQDRAFIRDRPVSNRNLVKSAERTIQILEFLDDVKTGANVADFADKLDIPQSSASALLRSLNEMGYLHYDETRRIYSSTARVSLLGSWIDPLMIIEGPLIQALRDIVNETGLDAYLTTRNRLHVQYIRFCHASEPVGYYATGSRRFLVGTATGHALLAGLSDTEIVRIVIATNSQLLQEQPRFTVSDVLAEIARVRAEGYATVTPRRSLRHSTIAVPLPAVSNDPLAIGVSISKDDPRQDYAAFAATIDRTVRRHLAAAAQ